MGFQTREVRAEAHTVKLDLAPLPAIIHWQGKHWVVLHRQQGQKYIIADPAIGIRQLTRDELLKGWNGVMLLLQPDDERFYAQSSDRVGGFGRFVRRVFPYRWTLLQALLINIAIGLLALAMPIMMQLLTDDVLVQGDLQLLKTVSIAVIAMNLFKSIISLIQSHLVGHFGQRLQLGLTLDYGFNLLRLPLTYFDAHRSGEVISRLGDIRTVNSLVGKVVLGLPSQFFIAILSLGLMLFYSWELTLASLLAFVVVTIVNLLFIPAIRANTRRLIIEGTDNQGFLVETFRSALILKTTQATPQVWDEYQQNFGRLTNLGWSSMKLGLYSSTLTGIISNLTTVGLLWFGSYLVIDRTLTIGQLISFNGLSANFLGFLGSVVGLANEFITAQIVIQRLSEVLDATPEEIQTSAKPWVQIPDNADITCDRINFHHTGRVDLLKDFSLTIPGGKVIALIGKSGCGKSTLAKLISGLYPLPTGNIRYGSYNQQDLSLECLRQQVVLVAQDAQFWSRSIIDNFRLSYPDVSFEQIVRACQITGADQFISELPEK